MDRRKALKMAAGAALGGSVGFWGIQKLSEPDYLSEQEAKPLTPVANELDWKYHSLDPQVTAELAYQKYKDGGCMYSCFLSIIKQLADAYGEPYASFPLHSMRYGHGGISGYGSICGTLNGAAAAISLFVPEKENRDKMITGLFRWYEEQFLPVFIPKAPLVDADIVLSQANSVLCHASVTNWTKVSGIKVSDKVRIERCRRLTADVAEKTVDILNQFFEGDYMAADPHNATTRTCLTCHGSHGKLDNTSGDMNCTSCHSKSVAHSVFAKPHYKVMK
ncbi:C-GCAxxG-C-C family (seleno)protein [Marinifilum flexuosum]|uniref:Putative redox-active protein with C_GCAxxG_C_C motif n=1 Tax=Marinifilum flexuosum TaxID=1117708 RepID=A0A419X4B1_9BACT|nr:C-GCAxxG-C-C family (seleno)protein [Marinifilum flexuosum]RKE02543.1 putative redox-active protein with C_GCAxxG_C_C motif [Marinifilum flexuosum]